jgi:long-subunit acyl-CoA synthetase (AMP-forming)
LPALDDGSRTWTRAELHDAVNALTERLTAAGTRVMATLADNSPAWVALDFAAAAAGVVHVPLPLFFTPQQIAHAMQAAGVDTAIASAPLAGYWPQARAESCLVMGHPLSILSFPARPAVMPPGTAKITFTSGTTGAPKGVCLARQTLNDVAQSLSQALAPLDIRRHLCALPFSVLLENVAGLMAPLSQGTTCIVPPLQRVGLTGSSTFDAARFQDAVQRHRPDSVILLPQMLRAWAGHLQATGQRAPDSLKVVAVGGAAVGTALIETAHRLGIPACEGYGLSEGSSVQTLNLPGANRPGSVGRALPHSSVRIADDGEVEIAGSLFLGYLADAAPPPAWWRTGDLGHLDGDGFLHIRGRRKNVLVTSFGRNVSPEWVETALRSSPAIATAVVFGDAQPALSAVLWPVRPDVPSAALDAAVGEANATLPDYAQVRRWVRARAAFDAASGLATANGRPQRAAIWRLHADALLDGASLDSR